MTLAQLQKLAELVAEALARRGLSGPGIAASGAVMDVLPTECEKGSFIYFAQIRNADGFIKIGHARDLSRRRTNYRTASPYPIEFLAFYYAPDHLEHEEALHEKFRHARVRGEWFRPTPDLLDLIATLQSRPVMT